MIEQNAFRSGAFRCWKKMCKHFRRTYVPCQQRKLFTFHIFQYVGIEIRVHRVFFVLLNIPKLHQNSLIYDVSRNGSREISSLSSCRYMRFGEIILINVNE